MRPLNFAIQLCVFIPSQPEPNLKLNLSGMESASVSGRVA